MTLPGIVPLLDRPSGVDDDAWEATTATELLAREERDDKTVVCEVPTFRAPVRPRPARVASAGTAAAPVAPPARAGDAGGAMVHAPIAGKVAAAPKPKRGRGWGVAMLWTAVVGALVAAGAVHGKSWLPRLERAVRSHLISSR